MELYLVIILLSCAKAGGLGAQAAHGRDQFDVSGDGDQASLPWNNLEDLAELEKNAEYSIKVIILTMNR